MQFIILPCPNFGFRYSKGGGERGIRTLDAPFETYMISNHALSTTQPSLLGPYSLSFFAGALAAGASLVAFGSAA